ncbi:GNAT family N-acetyltransferase [Actinopolymorpha singaporensis]
MKLQRLDPDDGAAVAATMTFLQAGRAADTPWDPPHTERGLVASLRYGWDGEPGEKWLLVEDGQVAGTLDLHFSQRDNTHMAYVGVSVHPDKRREGRGRALAEEGLARVRASGRRLAMGGTLDAEAPAAFAAAMGFAQASVEVQRRQDLTEVDSARVEELRARAAEAARDYTLIRMDGPVPDDLVDEVAEMAAAINDAPTDDLDIEDEVFDAKRVRGFEAAQEAAGNKLYRVIARRGTDGPLAGHTMVGVPAELPDWAWQWDTAVLGAHRGHRLGMLLKADMVTWLRAAEPSVRWLDTWNAESNAHMIGVNEALGYRIVTRHLGWQRAV